MKEQVQINYNAYYVESNFDDLKQAVTSLTTATEQQFETIKNEKWYTRLFNCITFSKKNSKRMASQISSLAQAQQILTEMLVRLSAKDAQVATLVYQNFQDIKKLSENDIYLEERIRYMENSLILGIHTSEDIRNLSKASKQVLSGCFYALSSIYSDSSSEQQEYANNVLNFIGFISSDSKVDNLDLAIETLEEKDRRIILTCCMEYMFLYELETNFPEEANCFIEKFDIGNKTIRNIEDKIAATYDLRGPNGIIEKYSQINFETINENGFFVEVDDLIENEEGTETEDVESDVTSSTESNIDIPLSFLPKHEQNRRIYDCVETKDYLIIPTRKTGFFTNHTIGNEGWNIYDKHTQTESDLSSVNFTLYKNYSYGYSENYTVDYANNIVYCVADDTLYRVDIKNDKIISYGKLPVLEDNCNKIETMILHKEYIIINFNLRSGIILYFDIKNQKFHTVRDAQGKDITNTSNCITAIDDKIYFYTSIGEQFTKSDGTNMKNQLCIYDLKTHTISKALDIDFDVYAIFTVDKTIYIFKRNSLLRLEKSQNEYALKKVIDFPYTTSIKISEKYFSYYDGNTFSIYVYDFKKGILEKVVNDCYRYENEGIFSVKWCKKSTFDGFHICGNWLYYYKDHTSFQEAIKHLYRVNINTPLQSVDLGKC